MNYENHYKTYLQYFLSFKGLLHMFFTFMKMSKDRLAKYYQNNKERIKKKLVKHIKFFLKWKKKESGNIVGKNTKI